MQTGHMLSALKDSLWNQFGASIDMLRNAIMMCPEDYFNSNKKFFYKAYHCILFLDYYLTIPPTHFSPLLPFSFTTAEDIPKDAVDDLVPDRIYSQNELLSYVQMAKIKCHDLIFSLTGEKLTQSWIKEPDQIVAGATMNFTVLDILLFNLRHVQHHIGQLNQLLRQGVDKSPDWVAIVEQAK